MKQNAEERQVGAELYALWVERHLEETIKQSAFLAAVSLIVVVILDPIIFPDVMRYAPLQLASTLLFVFAIGATTPRWAPLANKLKRSEVVLWVPYLCATLIYLYFVRTSPDHERWIVLIGTFMILFFAQMAVYEFSTSSAIVALGTLGSIVVNLFLVSDKQVQDSFMLLLIFEIIASAFFMRKRIEFVKSLSERHKILRNIFPPNKAKMICVADDDREFTNHFAPRMRPAVCLSTDWRGYQQLASRMDPRLLSQATDRFCEIVVNTLEKLDPSGNHYVTWVADLLFVIFFDESDDLNLAIEKAVKFTDIYCTDLFARARAEVFDDMLFDVGLAAGEGLLGLQGARSIKKTTITSIHAGTANRLEREAKRLRTAGESPNQPIVCIDSTIHRYLAQTGVDAKALPELSIEENDLKTGEKFFRWNYLMGIGRLARFHEPASYETSARISFSKPKMKI